MAKSIEERIAEASAKANQKVDEPAQGAPAAPVQETPAPAEEQKVSVTVGEFLGDVPSSLSDKLSKVTQLYDAARNAQNSVQTRLFDLVLHSTTESNERLAGNLEELLKAGKFEDAGKLADGVLTANEANLGDYVKKLGEPVYFLRKDEYRNLPPDLKNNINFLKEKYTNSEADSVQQKALDRLLYPDPTENPIKGNIENLLKEAAASQSPDYKNVSEIAQKAVDAFNAGNIVKFVDELKANENPEKTPLQTAEEKLATATAERDAANKAKEDAEKQYKINRDAAAEQLKVAETAFDSAPAEGKAAAQSTLDAAKGKITELEKAHTASVPVADKKIAELEAKLLPIHDEVTTLQLAEKTKQLEETKAELAKRDEQIKNDPHLAEIADYKTALDVATASLASLTTQFKEIKEQQKAAEEKANEAERVKTEAEGKVTKLEADLKTATENKTDAQAVAAKQAELDAAKGELTKAQTALQTANTEKGVLTGQVADLTEKLTAADNAKTAAEQQRDAAEKARIKAEQDLAEAANIGERDEKVTKEKPKVIARGSTGEGVADEIKEAQEVLKREAGYKGEIEGQFGSKTEEAVKALQKKHGLVDKHGKATGEIGGKTATLIDELKILEYIDSTKENGSVDKGKLNEYLTELTEDFNTKIQAGKSPHELTKLAKEIKKQVGGLSDVGDDSDVQAQLAGLQTAIDKTDQRKKGGV